MWLLFALVILPFVEIALFIQVGQWIGLWPTLGLIILASLAGITVMRRQGRNALAELQRAGRDLKDPTRPVAHGALILLGGFLLFIPGFFTDVLGILLLVPPLRRGLLAAIGRRVQVTTFRTGPLGDPRRPFEPPVREPHRPDVIIDGDFEELDPKDRPPSGWTRP